MKKKLPIWKTLIKDSNLDYGLKEIINKSILYNLEVDDKNETVHGFLTHRLESVFNSIDRMGTQKYKGLSGNRTLLITIEYLEGIERGYAGN